MNRKGFTLVELLAVIVILSLLALITVTSMTKLVNDSKEELSSTQINLIKSAAELWGSENITELPSLNKCEYITLGDLKKYGLLDNDIIDSKNNKKISDDLKIKITTSLNSKNELVRSYDVNPEDINGCKWSYIPCEYTTNEGGYKMVTCGTESFYVMYEIADEVTMLAAYNISSSAANPLQDPNHLYENYIGFSLINYWKNGGYSPAGTSIYPYIFDDQCLIKQQLENYEDTLNTIKKNLVIDARLMSYEQAIELGCSKENKSCENAPDWVHSTNYWLGSLESGDNVWYIENYGSNGSFNKVHYGVHDYFGIRPVIIISKSNVQ